MDLIWSDYSKYEHLGGLTYDIYQLPFDKLFHRVSISVYNILQAISLTIELKRNQENFRADEHNDEIKRIQKIYADHFIKEGNTPAHI